MSDKLSERDEQFARRPLVAGTVRGVRAFAVEKNRLTGPIYPVPFTPGENVAACQVGHSLVIPPAAWAHADKTSLVNEETPHRPGSKECAWGYYAYFNGHNSYFSPKAPVQDIIEGYGLVTVGDLGFRAEKARILALVHPLFGEDAGHSHPRWVDWLSDKVYSIFWSLFSPLLPFIIALVGFFTPDMRERYGALLLAFPPSFGTVPPASPLQEPRTDALSSSDGRATQQALGWEVPLQVQEASKLFRLAREG